MKITRALRAMAKWTGALTLGFTLLGASLPVGTYHLDRVLPIGGEGRWDFLAFDSYAQLLYVPRTNHVQIVAADTGRIVADVKGTPGVRGVALVPRRHRGFTSNSQDGTSTIFDAETGDTLGKIKTIKGADCILFDPFSHQVLSFSRDQAAMVALDSNASVVTAKASPPLALGGEPVSAVSDNAGHVYINLIDKNHVAVVDIREMRVIDRWSLDRGEGPTGIAMDAATRRLFICCRNQTMVVMNADNGNVVTTFPIGSRADAMAFDQGNIVASCGEGTLTVVREDDPNRFHLVQNLQTERGARTMVLDPLLHRIYLPTADLVAAPGPAPAHSVPVPGTFRMIVLSR